MYTPWKIIFQYQLNSRVDSQILYDEIFKSALMYKFCGMTGFTIPVNSKILTEAIFNLNDHDKLKFRNIEVSGKKLKELFITTIFLKVLESKFPKLSSFFVVVPEKERSVDTAVMITEPDVLLIKIDGTQFKLPKECHQFLFQVKEYVDFKRLQSDNFLSIQPIDVDKLNKVAGTYDEITIIFMRDFMQYHSDDLKDFFAAHPNCYLIATPDQSLTKYIPNNSTSRIPEKVKFNPSKHNYIITFSGQAFIVVSFDRPRFLLDRSL